MQQQQSVDPWARRIQAPPPRYPATPSHVDASGKRRYDKRPDYARRRPAPYGRGRGGPPRRGTGRGQMVGGDEKQPIREPVYAVEPPPGYDVEQYNVHDIFDYGINNINRVHVNFVSTDVVVPCAPPFTNFGDTITPNDTAGGCEATQTQMRDTVQSFNLLYQKPMQFYWNNGNTSTIEDITPSVPPDRGSQQFGSVPAPANYVDSHF